MSSVGASAASGIQAGFDMGLRATAAEDTRKQRGIDNQRTADLDAERTAQTARSNVRQDKVDAEHEDDRALTALTSQLDDARYQLGSLHAKYGDKPIPDSEAKPLYETVGKHHSARKALVEKRYKPVLEAQTQKWRDYASKAETGQVNPAELRGQDLRDFIKATTGHDLSEYVSGTVGNAINDATAGLQTKNTDLAVRAAGALLGPQIRQGLGGSAADGSQIVDKELFALVPAPARGAASEPQAPAQQTNPIQTLAAGLNSLTTPPAAPQPGQQQQPGGALVPGDDPDLVLPVLNVTTRQPDGRLTSYHAPVTQGRGTDGQLAPPLKISELMDRMGRLGVVDNWLKTPEMKAAVAEALQAGPSTFEQAWGMVHGDPKVLKNVGDDPTSKKIAAIKKLAEEHSIGFEAAARMFDGKQETGVQGKLAAIQTSGLSDAEKKTAERVALGVVKTPKAGGGTSSAALGGVKAPDPNAADAVDFWARAVIAGDKDWQVGLGRSKSGSELIEKVKRRVPQLAKELGLEPQDIGSERARSAALAGAQKDIVKRAEGVELFASKVEKDMKTFDGLIDKASTGSPMLISKPINALRRQFSDADLAQLDLAASQVGKEYERLISGGSLSVAQLHAGAAEDAKKLINGDMTPKQARAVMDVMRMEMKNAREAAHESEGRIRDRMRGLGRGNGPAAPPAPGREGITGESPKPGAPTVGTVLKGYRFKGGDPSQQANWEKQ